LSNQIQDVIHNLAVDKNIAFVWVPGHSNIQGNETADKAATNLQMPSDLKMDTCDLKSKKKAKQQGKINGNKQRVTNIKQTMKRWEYIKVFNRMRIGHTHLTHSCHMNHLAVTTATRL
jgi:hypothetical protein